MENQIIQQGAEAIILKEKNNIIKKRIKKSYRIKELDEKIRKLRTRSETKLLLKASEEILTPKVIKSDEKSKEIIMEFIDGKKLSDHLDKFSKKEQKEICKKIGKSVGKIHSKNIIHGDLTTSNMILKSNKIYFIDFGLGSISHKYEDKAVDLHLLRQALEAKHFKYWEELFEEVLKGYQIFSEYKIVLERLKAVEKRGRYKH
ncbi:Kae1-associated serine/threonine protein kinase [Candidatus Pacearchaeota archaeon]|nr:Kae1-associated serine/threonine protein kinase [Candidatus Pacearchaeota archaeon]